MGKEKRYETVLVIVLGLTAVYWFKRTHALLVCALLIGLVAICAPAAAQGIHWFWTKLSRVMGILSGKLLLTLVYFLVLIPLSFLARWSGKISIRKKASGGTHFKERNYMYSKEDIIHPW